LVSKIHRPLFTKRKRKNIQKGTKNTQAYQTTISGRKADKKIRSFLSENRALLASGSRRHRRSLLFEPYFKNQGRFYKLYKRIKHFLKENILFEF